MGAQRHDQSHHRHGDDHTHLFDTPEAAERAEIEGEVLLPMTEQAVTLVVQQCDRRGQPVRTIVDVGCGPGVGTCVLAERFPEAEVVAADGSDAMLTRAAARAEAHGLGARVRTRPLALPGDLDELDGADLIWASMVLHHVGDEVDALRRIRAALEPHGLLALVERAESLHVVLPDVNLGRPGLWSRAEAAREAWFQEMRAGLPDSTASSDYAEMLTAAGYDVLVDEVLSLGVPAPLDDRAARFAKEHLTRTRSHLESWRQADPADLEALDHIIAGWDAGGRGRNEATLRGARRLLVAAPRRDP